MRLNPNALVADHNGDSNARRDFVFHLDTLM
jgi:hypothetical protein